VDAREAPAAGAFDGDEEGTPGGFVGHSGRVDVDVDFRGAVSTSSFQTVKRVTQGWGY
jgi:hypothetical protein